jgi:hypothetical protein
MKYRLPLIRQWLERGRPIVEILHNGKSVKVPERDLEGAFKVERNEMFVGDMPYGVWLQRMVRKYPYNNDYRQLLNEYNAMETRGQKPTQAQYNPFAGVVRGIALGSAEAGEPVEIKLVTDGPYHQETSYSIPPGNYNVVRDDKHGIVFLTDADYVPQGEQVDESSSITLTVDQMLREEIQKTQFAEEVARKKALLANYGVDDFENGQILSFPKRLPNAKKDQGYETYQYAALKVKGMWYLTRGWPGPVQSPKQWADLVIWLIEGDWPTKAEEVGLASFRAQDDLASHAKQSRAIEAPQVDTTPDPKLSNEKDAKVAGYVESTYTRPIKDNPQA